MDSNLVSIKLEPDWTAGFLAYRGWHVTTPGGEDRILLRRVHTGYTGTIFTDGNRFVRLTYTPEGWKFVGWD